MASSDKEAASKDSIPLEELQHYRGVAQEQSMNTLLSAQRDTHSHSHSTRDCIYDAIADAKKQISEREKMPFGRDVKEGQEEKSVDNASLGKQEESEESGSTGVSGTLGDVLSGYAKNLVGADVANGNNTK